jgi:hypothetical protein
MNIAINPADQYYSVAWPDRMPYDVPPHVAESLDAAERRLAASNSDNRGHVLLRSALSTAIQDLCRLLEPVVRVNLIGNVGNGKTTALCILANLTRSDEAAGEHRARRVRLQIRSLERKIEKLAAKATAERPTGADIAAYQLARRRRQQLEASLAAPIGPADADRLLLPAAGGRTTLCPMSLQYAPAPAIQIVPLEPGKLRSLVTDFAEGLYAQNTLADGERPEEHVSEETRRALKNMAGATNADLKDMVARANSASELADLLLARINPAARSKVRHAPQPSDDASEWLAATVADINYGRASGAPYPARLEIFWPGAPQGLELIDTRGLDAHVTEDVRARIEDRDAVAVLCSSFTGVPDAMTIAALRHAKVMGRRHGMALLALARQESDLAGYLADDEDPCERKVQEALNRLTQEKLPSVCIVAGAVQIHGQLMAEAISAAVDDLKSTWEADLARHLGVLIEAMKEDHGAILDELARYQAAHVATLAGRPAAPDMPRAARLFEFPEPPHSSTLAACIRRRGAYENLNAAHVATGAFTAAIADAADKIEIMLLDSARTLRPRAPTAAEDAAFEIVMDRIDAFQREVRSSVSKKLIDLVVKALEDHPADEVFDICQRAWGQGSREVRGKETYRSFVIRHLDAWMTDDQELGSMLAANALAIWQREIDAAVRHEDAYTRSLASQGDR